MDLLGCEAMTLTRWRRGQWRLRSSRTRASAPPLGDGSPARSRHRVSRNHAQIEADVEGNFELCLAHRDHGHPNTILTVGHHAGYLLLRVLLPEEEIPELSIQVLYEREWKRPSPAR